MLRKVKSSRKGPSWFEVGLGAFLSVILGIALGIALLASKPVSKVTEIPKDPPPGAVYYIEGSRDFNKTPEVEEKRKSFVAGESISVEEGELNILLSAGEKPAAAPAAAPAKPGDKAPDAPPTAPSKLLDVGTLNARIHEGHIQFAAPVTVTAFTVSATVIVQTTGTFLQRGSGFVFDPDSIYVGGCPVSRVPVLRELVLSKLLFVQPVPADIAASWSRLAAVTIDGSTLKLKMP
jgi:hypothetical protein